MKCLVNDCLLISGETVSDDFFVTDEHWYKSSCFFAFMPFTSVLHVLVWCSYCHYHQQEQLVKVILIFISSTH